MHHIQLSASLPIDRTIIGRSDGCHDAERATGLQKHPLQASFLVFAHPSGTAHPPEPCERHRSEAQQVCNFSMEKWETSEV